MTDRRAIVPLDVRDPAASLMLLSRLVASFDEAGPQRLQTMMGAGLKPELVERLRGLSMSDAAKLADGHGVPGGGCGLALAVDMPTLERQLARLERLSADRQRYEDFVRAGANARLLRRLFGVRVGEARLLRRLLTPELTVGGRPKALSDELRSEVLAAWRQAPTTTGPGGERERYWFVYEAMKRSVRIDQIEAAVSWAQAMSAHGIRR